MKIFGLTGGIASGKSEVAKLFASQGIPVIDADQIAKTLSQKGGEAYPLILSAFGTADRAELRKIIFDKPEARSKLENILHPLIKKESELQFAELRKQVPTPKAVVYEAALLVETGRYKDFDGLIVVDAPLAMRKKRLIARDQISAELADKILNAQSSDSARLKLASHVITNRTDLRELQLQVTRFIRSL